MRLGVPHVIELKTFAIVQGPNSGVWFRVLRGYGGTDMMILLPSLACNFSFAASLRTRIPRQNRFAAGICHEGHTYIAWPRIQRPPLRQYEKVIFQRQSVKRTLAQGIGDGGRHTSP